jgi:hypothetical protein
MSAMPRVSRSRPNRGEQGGKSVGGGEFVATLAVSVAASVHLFAAPRCDQGGRTPPCPVIGRQFFSLSLVARNSARADVHSGESSVPCVRRHPTRAPLPRSTVAQNFCTSAAQAVRIFTRASLTAGDGAAGAAVVDDGWSEL